MHVLAAELHNILPAAYRMLQNCGSVVLLRVELIKKLLSNSIQDQNLKQLLQQLHPQQRLFNIIFDEMKLTKTLKYSGSRVVDYAENFGFDNKVLATHTLVVEVVCHFGGPKYILRIHPIAKLNSNTFKEMILAALVTVDYS